MKTSMFKRFMATVVSAVMLFSDGTALAAARTLTLPKSVKIIDARAFYGSKSIDKVVIPEGTTEIRSQAFADSSLTEAYLPASLTYIADDAFDDTAIDGLTAAEGSYAEQWLLSQRAIHVTGVTLDQTSKYLTVGAKFELSAAVEPDNATNTEVTWTSSDNKIATVSDSGVVSAVGEGSAMIRVKTKDSAKTASCEVIVAAKDVQADQTVVITGRVEKQDGTGYPYVTVKLKTEDGVLVKTIYTNTDGSYSFALTSGAVGEDFVLSFSKNDLTLTPESITVHVTNALKISADTVTVAEKESSVTETCSFTADKTSIAKDESVVFTITAPETADSVRMYADGVNYPGDEVAVTDGAATMTRTFTSAHPDGVQITFAPVICGEIGRQSAAQTIVVTSNGSLDTPVLNAPEIMKQGEDYTFTAAPAANTEHCKAILYGKTEGTDDGAYSGVWDSEEITESVSLTIPADAFSVGEEYQLMLICGASGYESSSAVQNIAVDKVDYGLTVSVGMNDSNHLTVDTAHDSGYLRVVVKSPDGKERYWPAVDEQPTAESPASHTFSLNSAGVWTTDVYVYASEDAVVEKYADYYSSTQYVQGPAITAVLPYGKDCDWVSVDESKTFMVNTNTSVDEVVISENGSELGRFTEYTESGSNWRIFNCTLSAASAAKHTYNVTGISNSSSLQARMSKTFNAVKAVAYQKYVYANDGGLFLVQSPMDGTPVSYVRDGEDFDEMTVIGETEDWYQVKFRKWDQSSGDYAEGFVSKEEVSDDPPALDTRTLTIVYPANGEKIVSSDSKIDAYYRVNFSPESNGMANGVNISIQNDSGETVYSKSFYYTTNIFGNNSTNIYHSFSSTWDSLPAGHYVMNITLGSPNNISGSSDFYIVNSRGSGTSTGSIDVDTEEVADEDAYRALWKKSLSEYNKLTGTEYNGATMGLLTGWTPRLGGSWSKTYAAWFNTMDGLFSGYMAYPSDPFGFSNIYRSAALAWIDQFNDAYYSERVGNTNSNISMMDDEKKEQAIQQMIMESCDDALGTKNLNNNTLSSVALANNDINLRNSEYELLYNCMQAVRNGVNIGVDAYKLKHAFTKLPESDPLSKVIDKVGDAASDLLDMILQGVDVEARYNFNVLTVRELAEAYAFDYEKAMLAICDESIDYLKTTYFGDSWTGNSADYNSDPIKEQAYLVICNYENLKGNTAAIRTEARGNLLKKVGLSEEDLEKIYTEYGDEGMTLLFQKVIKKITKGVLKEGFKQAIKAALQSTTVCMESLDEKKIDALVDTVYKTEACDHIVNAISTAVDECFAFENGKFDTKLFGEKFAQFLATLSDIDYGTLFENTDYKDLIKLDGSLMMRLMFIYAAKENIDVPGTDGIKMLNNVLSAAESLYNDCWSFGKNVAYAWQAAYDAGQQKAGKAKFETECGYLTLALDMISEVKRTAGIVELESGNIDIMSVEQLQTLRDSVITLLDYELVAVSHYANMKKIKEDAGKTGEEWLQWYRDADGNLGCNVFLLDETIQNMQSYLQSKKTTFTNLVP